MSDRYRPSEIEPKWQERWAEQKTFAVSRPDGREKYYILEMLPYPSGRLHMGHVRNYTMGDVVARFQRMLGKAVMHPIGWDSLGLPAENAAIERNADPREWTVSNIAAMNSQLQRLGLAYDWDREIASHTPEYYRWNQWMFLKFLEKGLAYRKNRAVNWCESCKTVLANEQVEDDACERCHTPVETRELEQWFLRTTHYQKELLDALDDMPGWPEALRKRQSGWIGRSEGATITFPIHGKEAEVKVFTTRVDTIFGCTFVVIAPDHPVLDSLDLSEEKRAELATFAKESAGAHVAERGVETEKLGIPTGALAVNPFTGENVPVWAGNFVVKDYGTGAVMSVPAHDLRDLDFAKKYSLPIVPVIQADDADEPEAGFTGEGTLCGSLEFDGMKSAEARAAMVSHGEAAGFAEATTTYRLRDWGISRQRYWGTPIPIIHCVSCGAVPVPYEDLPVVLPDRVELTGEARPLARHEAFSATDCPKCGGAANRDPDTMDTFVDSSWYFFRYLDPNNEELPVSAQAVEDWMPIDLYIGGPEHAVGHLIYCRWWSRAMEDIGLASPGEPVTRMIHHGMITKETQSCPEHGWRYPEEVTEGKCNECGQAVETGDVVKMSKRLRNTVEPDACIQRLGADAVRLFVMFSAPPGKELEWMESGAEGMSRFLFRVWRLALREGMAETDSTAEATTEEGEALDTLRHRCIDKVTTDVRDRLHFNTGISALMELSNAIATHSPVDSPLPADAAPIKRAVEDLLRMLSIYAPHCCEEAWERMGHETWLSSESWPVADPSRLVDDTVTLVVQVNGKLRGKVEVPRDADEATALAAAQQDSKVDQHLQGTTTVKVIHVPNRLLNLVVRPA